MKHAVAVALAALALVALALGAWIGVNIRGDDNPWLARAQAVADESGWQEGRIDAYAFQLQDKATAMAYACLLCQL